jgi:hypothetical protein
MDITAIFGHTYELVLRGSMSVPDTDMIVQVPKVVLFMGRISLGRLQLLTV